MSIQLIKRCAFVLVVLFGSVAWADTLSERDQQFLEQAAQNGHAEVSASQLALIKARDPRVRTFAQLMIEDHERVAADLNELAASKKYTPPKEPSMLQKGKEMLIANLSDENFDRRYIGQMGVKAHQETIRFFEEASREARDPQVKAFAVKHLPALRSHLQAAQELKVSIDPAGTTTGSQR